MNLHTPERIIMQIDSAYLAPPGYTEQLAEEIARQGGHLLFQRGRLFGVKGLATPLVWAENTWFEPRFHPVPSIKQGAAALKALQRNWAYFPTEESGRGKLIQEALPHVSAKPHVFGTPAPAAPLGSWTMWDKYTLLASAACQSPFPHGAALFDENRVVPPNRAYLKLWEGLTRLGTMPGRGDLCLDLGSSPGGWTWVLASLGARVFSVDKAPLAPAIARMPQVEYCAGSAFGLDPAIAGRVSWLFCDVACYPERLYGMIERWLERGECDNFFCTIKFAGETDFAILEKFCAIAGSFAMHLSVNKHEVTWVRMRAC